PDQERARCLSGTQAERDFQSGPLGVRQLLAEIERTGTEVVERSERELHLPFDSGSADDPEVSIRLRRGVEQRGLPYAQLSIHNENPAAALTRGFHDAVEP